MSDRRSRAKLTAACVAILGALIAQGASAGPLSALDPRLTEPQVASWLAERGLDAGAVTVQSGSALYAGPACPSGFECVPVSGPVLQFVAEGGIGIIDCEATECVAYQQSFSGDTVQNCTVIQRGENLDQNCDVTTDNVAGNSTINIRMEAISRNPIVSTGAVTQYAQQTAACRMTNVSGTNTLNVRQLVDQFADININLPVQHKQQANSALSCRQVNGSGANVAKVDVDHVLRAHAVGTNTVQQQNVDNVRPSVDLNLDQSQTNGGNATADVDVDQTFDAEALTASGTSAMRQGPHDASGQVAETVNAPLNAIILQNGGTASTFDADLTRTWTQKEDRLLGAPSSVDNSQGNTIRCCLGLEDVQLSPRTATIDILSTMIAPTDAAQRVRHSGRAKCDQACDYASTINFDQQQVTRVAHSDKVINNYRDCTHAAGQCGDGQAVNLITFVPGVRCEQPCGNEIYQRIDEGPDGSRIGYRGRIQTFVPKGQSPISDMRLTLTLPAGITLVKASGCQNSGGEISCKAGTGEQGGLREIFMTFKVAPGASVGQEFTFVATVYSGNNPNIEPVTRDAIFRIIP